MPLTLPRKVTALVFCVLHTSWSDTSATVGVGFTLIVNVVAVPLQPLAVGVTENRPVIMLVPLFVPANAATLFDPFAAVPMLVLLLVQL